MNTFFHIDNFTFYIDNNAYVLELGAIKASGSAKSLLTDDGIKKTYLGL